MPYRPHWERNTAQLRSRRDQIADEQALDKRIPRLKKRKKVEPVVVKKDPVRTTFTLNH